MRLFNQTSNHLKTDLEGHAFECEPWGSVEIEESLVEHALKRGMPLGTIPVAPEVKAHARVEEAAKETRDELVEGLRSQILRLEADVNVAKAHAEATIAELDKSKVASVKLSDDLRLAREEMVAVRRSLEAAEALLSEQAGNESEELRALTAKAADAIAARGGAEDAAKRSEAAASAAREQLAGTRSELEALKANHERMLADKRAADDLLDETAKSAKEALARAETAEKALAQLREKRKGAQPDQRA